MLLAKKPFDSTSPNSNQRSPNELLLVLWTAGYLVFGAEHKMGRSPDSFMLFKLVGRYLGVGKLQGRDHLHLPQSE